MTNPSTMNAGPQNHVNYLKAARDAGYSSSETCTHGAVTGFPKPSGNYSHVVLACGGGLTGAFQMWMMTPFHSQPLLSPVTTAVGAAEDSVRWFAAADVSPGFGNPNKIYTWPKNGGMLPRPQWWGTEGPNPISLCTGVPEDQLPRTDWGQPAHVWYPANRKYVSSSIKDASGTALAHCALTDSLTKASVGTIDSTFALFPENVLTVGATYTATIVTTDTAGANQTSVTFTFTVANRPTVSGSFSTGALQVSGTLNASTGAATGGLPITGYQLVARSTSTGPVAWTRTLTPGNFTVDAPAGDWWLCLQVKNTMESSKCSPWLRTVTKKTLTVRATDVIRQTGMANGTLTTTMTGWAGTDSPTSNDLTGSPACTTTATSASPAGSYPITCTAGSLASARYDFTFVPGVVVVTDNPVTTTGTPQTVSVTAPSTTTYGATVNVTASASSSQPVTVYSATPQTCTVSGTSVTAVDTGTCSLVGVQPGGSGFAAASGSAGITVGKASLSVSPRDVARGPSDATPTPTSVLSGFVLGETLATSGVIGQPTCTSAGMTTTTPGRYSFSCLGNLNSTHYQLNNSGFGYLLVAAGLSPTSATGTTTQTITGSLPNVPKGSTGQLTHTASSGLAVTYVSLTPSVCSVSGSTLTALTTGICTIGYLQAGDTTWSTKTGTASYTVQDQTITWGALSWYAYYGTSLQLSATASSVLPVTFSTTTPAVCDVTGTTATPRAQGTCTIVASQPGNGGSIGPVSDTTDVSVFKASLQAFPTSVSRMVGEANPPLTVTYTGFVNGETLATSGITGALDCTTTATTSSPAGSYPITCTMGTWASDRYTPSLWSGTLKVTNPLPTQTVTFGAGVPTSVTYGSPVTLSATASSGLGVTYSSLTTAVCTVSGATVTTVGVGTCTVKATQAGNASWAPASATRDITVDKKTLTVTADAKSKTAGTANPALTATITGFAYGQTLATSGVTGSPACTTTATTTSPAGSYPITCATGTLAAANYTFAFTPGTLSVGQASQTITFTPPSGLTYGSATSLIATASSGLAVTFTSGTPGVCTITGTLLTATGAGTCTITATQAGNGSYSPAAAVTQDVTIGKKPLFIQAVNQYRFTTQPNPDPIHTITGFAFDDTLATSGITGTVLCTTTATSASPAGSYPITCNTGTIASTKYAFVFTDGTLTVTQAPQYVAWDAPTSLTYGDTTVLTATATSGLPVDYLSFTPELCTVNGSTLTTTGVGTCTVLASQSGNIAYRPTNATRDITVGKKSLTVTADPKSRTIGTANPTLTATITGFAHGQTLATSGVTGTPACTTTATTTSPAGAYPITCVDGTLAAANYWFAFTPGTLSVGLSSQTVTFAPPAALTYGDSAALSATASSGLAVTFTSSTPGVCTVSGSTVTATGVGTCTITANQAGNSGYSAAAATKDITIGKRTLQVSAANQSRLTTQANPTPIHTFTGFAAGQSLPTSGVTGSPACTATATAGSPAGNYPIVCTTGSLSSTNYTFTFSDGTLTVNPAPQTLAWAAGSPTALTYGDTTALSATASSGLPVTYTSSTPGVCTVTDATLTTTGVGTCTIAANQTGNGTYSPAATATRDLTVGQRTLTVTADAKTKTTGTANPALTATITGFAHGQTLATSGVTGAATCTTTATATSPVGSYPITCATGTLTAANYRFTFSPGALSITNAQLPQEVSFSYTGADTYGSRLTPTTTATSGLPVTLASGTPTVCTVDPDGKITLRAIGQCQLSYRQDGNEVGEPSPTLYYYLQVKRALLTITAKDVTRAAGTANPAFGYTLTGLVNGDTAVAGQPSCTAPAATSSPAGYYTITCTVGSLTSPNYSFVFTPGLLTVTAAQVTSPNAPFVKASYQDFLGRQPSDNELRNTTTALDNGTLTRQAFLQQMATSNEWVSVIVTKFYRDTLGRDPDPGGFAHWNYRIANGIESVASVGGGFYSSEEFYRRSGNTDATWITALYRDILGRTPTSSDITFWSSYARAYGRTAAATQIYQSQESRNKRVIELYQTLLKRNPDPAGMSLWPGRLLTTGDIVLAIDLANSLEYELRAHTRYPNP